jgi:hypothetical protein
LKIDGNTNEIFKKMGQTLSEQKVFEEAGCFAPGPYPGGWLI